MPVIPPFRLEVMRALTAQLEAIEYDDGLNRHSLAGAVFRGRSVFTEHDPLPMISVLEDPQPDELKPGPARSALSTQSYTLLVQGFCVDDPTHPTDAAHYLLAEIKLALAAAQAEAQATDRVFGFGPTAPTAVSLTYGPGTVRPPDGSSSTAYCWLPVVIKIVENNAEPYRDESQI